MVIGFPRDTDRDALRAQFAALRRLSIQQKLALMDDVTELARRMCREGIRRRNPDASEAELERMFFELTLGRELAAKVLEHREQRRKANPA
jgi:hypothetical protein